MKSDSLISRLTLSALALVFICAASSAMKCHAEEPDVDDDKAKKIAAAANAAAAKSEAEDDANVVVRGKFHFNNEGGGAGGGGEVGSIVTDKDTYKVITTKEEFIKKLKENDDKVMSLKGLLNEQEKTLSLRQIMDNLPPPAEIRNPRGL